MVSSQDYENFCAVYDAKIASVQDAIEDVKLKIEFEELLMDAFDAGFEVAAKRLKETQNAKV